MKTSEVFKKTFGSLSDTVKEVRQQNLITNKMSMLLGRLEKVTVSKPVIFSIVPFLHYELPPRKCPRFFTASY